MEFTVLGGLKVLFESLSPHRRLTPKVLNKFVAIASIYAANLQLSNQNLLHAADDRKF